MSHFSTSGSNYDWNEFVKKNSLKWSEMFDWIYECPEDHSILMVRYEDLQKKTVVETKRMLDFLSFSVEGKLVFIHKVSICPV